MNRGKTGLMLSRVCSILSIVSSLGLLLPLILDRPLIQSILVSSFLLFNAFVSSLVFPSIELRRPMLYVPQLFACVFTQVMAIVIMMCAVMELDGQKTILSHYQPDKEWWDNIGTDFTVGVLSVWSVLFLIGNFVTFIHFRTFSSLRKSVNESDDGVPTVRPPPYSLFTLQSNGRPEGAPPSYEDIQHKDYTIHNLPH